MPVCQAEKGPRRSPGRASSPERPSRPLLHRSSLGPQGFVIQTRQGDAMIALDVKALAAVGHGSHQDGLPGAIVIAWIALGSLAARVAIERDQIKDRCGEMTDDAAF